MQVKSMVMGLNILHIYGRDLFNKLARQSCRSHTLEKWVNDKKEGEGLNMENKEFTDYIYDGQWKSDKYHF